jgi:hypothetical protein
MPDSRVVIAAALCAGLLVGYAVGGWLHGPAPGRPVAAPDPEAGGGGSAPPLEAEIAALGAALDEERGRRGALEMEIEMLRREIFRDASPEAGSPPAPEGGGAPGSEAATAAREGAPEAPAHGAPARSEWFDEADLIERGIDERRAARLHEHFDELQMEELYLRDEAIRGRWLGRPRYHERVRDLRSESREEIGDDDYDLLLYASGRNNRVLLSDVLQNSPAAAAGIEPGDILVRYGGRAIFDIRDLISETTRDGPGSTVPVDLVRDGQRRRVYVPRGPLGARIEGTRHFPAEGS